MIASSNEGQLHTKARISSLIYEYTVSNYCRYLKGIMKLIKSKQRDYSPSSLICRLINFFFDNTSCTSRNFTCPVGWGCKIHRLLRCRGVRPPTPPTSVLDMTLNNLMVRFQQCWSFGECGVPLHCHHSQVHSGPEW